MSRRDGSFALILARHREEPANETRTRNDDWEHALRIIPRQGNRNSPFYYAAIYMTKQLWCNATKVSPCTVIVSDCAPKDGNSANRGCRAGPVLTRRPASARPTSRRNPSRVSLSIFRYCRKNFASTCSSGSFYPNTVAQNVIYNCNGRLIHFFIVIVASYWQ